MSLISTDTYIKTFEKLLNDNSISEFEFDSLVEDLIHQVPLGAQSVQIPFLIRTSLLNKNEVCTNISRCSYVPDSKKSKIPLQRCNVEGQQVFYASIAGGMANFSDGAQPSLMETTMQKILDDSSFNGRVAAVSRWQIINQPIFWFLPYYSNSIANNKNFHFLYNHFDNSLKGMCQSDDDYLNFTEKLKYLSELFCKNSNREKAYKITATYYNKIMIQFKPFDNFYDALIYPSANTMGEGMNIVLTKDYIDQKNIWCDLVVLYEINRNVNNPKDIWFIPFAEANPDKLGNLIFKQLH
ncbi:hypothetical protein ACFOW1_16680 [Parasediminibacterium paludis]|uniref:RES domain-containing protein n=1 Tax=Parasediminibacterium paludis TaxID=908966 RepID=A0ABV8Q150_9BACT